MLYSSTSLQFFLRCIMHMYLKKLELHNQEQTMKLKRILCNILLSPIHLCNRDASSVMLAGSQAWDWGFLTHHALFIDQSNRVCKMRITQHEENRGEGTEGRWEEERRKDRGAKVTHCGRKTWRRGRNEKKKRKKGVTWWTLSDLYFLFLWA